jgi:hypothetical protein
MDELDQSIIDIYELLPYTYTILGPFISNYAIAKLVEEYDERFTEMEKLRIRDGIIDLAEGDGFTILPEKQFDELFANLADWAVKHGYAEYKKEEDQEHLTPDPLLGHPATPCDRCIEPSATSCEHPSSTAQVYI